MNELKIPTNLECNSIEAISLNEQRNYRLMEIGKIKDYLEQEIKYQQLLTSQLSKYLTGFDHAEKILTVFSTFFSGANIFAHVIGEKRLLGLITFVFSLLFCLSSGVVKKLQQETKTRKKKQNKLLYLAKNKVDSVEMVVSESLMDGIIEHKEFLAIMKEKKDYGKMK